LDVLRYFSSRRAVLLAGQRRMTATALSARSGKKARADVPAPLSVLRHVPAAFRLLYRERERRVSAASGPKERAQLARALRLLELARARGFIEDTTSFVLLFRGSHKNSFYDPRAHGTVFVRVSSAQGELHLVEELVHQAGHAALEALRRERGLLRVKPETPFDDISSERTETRSTLVAFHALVTQGLIVETLSRLVRNRQCGAALPELVGRLAFATTKLGADLRVFVQQAELLRTEGLFALRSVTVTYGATLERYDRLLSAVSLRNQPYVFCPSRFAAENPALPAVLHSFGGRVGRELRGGDELRARSRAVESA
jgi:hypothetical protein